LRRTLTSIFLFFYTWQFISPKCHCHQERSKNIRTTCTFCDNCSQRFTKSDALGHSVSHTDRVATN